MKWLLVTILLITFSVSVHAKELAQFHLLCALFQILFLHFPLLLRLSCFPLYSSGMCQHLSWM